MIPVTTLNTAAGIKAPPGDPGPRGHPYDYPPGEEGRYSYSQYGYEE